jgi:hypothetical protein
MLGASLALTSCSQWNDVHTSLRERTQEALNATFGQAITTSVRTAWRGVGDVRGLVCGRANVRSASGSATLRFTYEDSARRHVLMEYGDVLAAADPRFARERQFFAETWDRECAPTMPFGSSFM